MQLTKFLFRYSAIFFFLFLLLTIWAFWNSYFNRLFDEMPNEFHLHGISMTLWCILLVIQPLLIRYKKISLHKSLGICSPLLVILVAYSGINVAHLSLSGVELQFRNANYYYFAALTFNSIIAFLILYGFALFFRKNSAIHARLMLCTVFPIVTPVSDRIIFNYFPSLVSLTPTLNNAPIVPALGFTIVNVLLIGLILWDWISHKRLNVFPFVLALLLLYHYSVLKFYDYGFWQSFVNWLMTLPLS